MTEGRGENSREIFQFPLSMYWVSDTSVVRVVVVLLNKVLVFRVHTRKPEKNQLWSSIPF